jgi:hypothetical protein
LLDFADDGRGAGRQGVAEIAIVRSCGSAPFELRAKRKIPRKLGALMFGNAG